MKFLLRVDDFGWTHEEGDKPPLKRRDHMLALASEFVEALNGIPILAGVIPSCVDEAGARWLKSRPDVTVALHGFNHSEPSPGDRHEFEGASPAAVRNRISEGHRIVGPTQFFIPPFNSLDFGHVEAMWHEGIRYIFGREQEWPTPPSPVELSHGVKFMPAWARLYGALGWKQGAASRPIMNEIDDLFDKPGFAVMTLHLPWEAARDPRFSHTRTLGQVWKGHFISAADFVKEIK